MIRIPERVLRKTRTEYLERFALWLGIHVPRDGTERTYRAAVIRAILTHERELDRRVGGQRRWMGQDVWR